MHPSYLVDDETRLVVQLWQMWRPSGFGGFGALPFSGGTAEQPASLMDAFNLCLRVAGWAKPAKGESDS